MYKEENVLIPCRVKPVLIGRRDEYGQYRIPLVQRQGQMQPRRPSKKAGKILQQANSIYDLPSSGYINFVATR